MTARAAKSTSANFMIIENVSGVELTENGEQVIPI